MIVSGIKQDIGPKCHFFMSHFHLTCTIIQNPFEFLSKILTQTARVCELLNGVQNIVEKFNPVSVNGRHRRQTLKQNCDDIMRT